MCLWLEHIYIGEGIAYVFLVEEEGNRDNSFLSKFFFLSR